jgi:hypothetical protein
MKYAEFHFKMKGRRYRAQVIPSEEASSMRVFNSLGEEVAAIAPGPAVDDAFDAVVALATSALDADEESST